MNITKNEDNYHFAPFTEQRREIRKDWNRYNSLQKHYKLLTILDQDGDIIDDIDWAICSSLNIEFGDAEDLKKAFETIREYIEKAQQQILIESKTFL